MMTKLYRTFFLLTLLTANISRAEEYVGHSVLADGRWTKVSTDTAGIYEITYDELQQWGYPTPEKVKIFGVGPLSMADDMFPTGRIADDLPQTYSINDPVRKKIFFYSPGTVSLAMNEVSAAGGKITRSPYTSRADFLLTDKDVPAYEPEKTSVNYDGQPLADNHYSLQFIEYELRNPADGGATMLGPDISVSHPMTITFDYRDYCEDSTAWTPTLFHLNFAGADFQSQTRVSVTPDPTKLSADKITTFQTGVPFINDEAIVFRPGTLDLRWDVALDGPVNFTVTPYGGSSPKFLAFDNAWTAYLRRSSMNAADATLDLFFPRITSQNFFGISINSEALHVLNVTDPANIYEHQLHIDNNRAIGAMPAVKEAGTHLIAFNPDVAQRPVSFKGQAANTDLHGAEVPEMLIITTAELYDAARELAAIHWRTDGLACLVAIDEDICNEFGMANRDAMAYRRAAKMFYDRDPERFRYLLLYGPGHWDNRGLIDGHDGEMLLTYQSKDPVAAGHKTRNFNADAFYGMVDNLETASDDISAIQMKVAVGRIPVAEPAAARCVNEKIERYLAGPWPAELYTKVLVMSDDGDQNIHFSQAENTIDILRQSDRPFTVIRAHNLLYDWDGTDAKAARNLIINSLKEGVGLMTYTGHGNPGSFTSEMMWSRASILSTDHDFTPFAFLSTCDALSFDRDDVGIGQTMLLKGGGGVAGVVGASRTVYSPHNYELAKSLMRSYSQASPGATIGEIWKDSRNTTVSGRLVSAGLRYNTMCYNLCGDPSLPVRVPNLEMALDSLDGRDPASVSVLSSRKPITVSGHVDDTNFNGTANITVYDTPLSLSTKPRNPANDGVLPAILDHNPLFSKNVEVLNGRFSTSIVLPDPTTENDSLMSVIIFTADNLNGTGRAAGQLRDILIKADRQNPDQASFAAPVIESIVLDGLTMTAEGLSGGADINTSAGSIGMAPVLTLDPETKGETRFTVSPREITWNGNRWTLTRQLPELAPGRHALRLSITDNVGNRVRAEHAFVIETAATLTLETDSDHPVLTKNSKPTFELTGDIAGARLIVRDLRGKTCLTVDNPTFPYTLSQPESPLQTGLYEVYVSGTLSDGTPFGTSAVTIAVVASVTQ